MPLVNMFSVLNQTPPLEIFMVLPDSGFSDPLAVEHLITDFLIDLEATFDPSFPVALAVERFVLVAVVHKHRLPIDKLQCATWRLKLSLVISAITITPWWG